MGAQKIAALPQNLPAPPPLWLMTTPLLRIVHVDKRIFIFPVSRVALPEKIEELFPLLSSMIMLCYLNDVQR